MPKCLHDCVLIPIQKNNRKLSSNKVIEHIILSKYEKYLCPLQFGFKPGLSTSHCTVLIKYVVARFINNGSTVLGCFLDASKAFNRVDHAWHERSPSTYSTFSYVMVSSSRDEDSVELKLPVRPFQCQMVFVMVVFLLQFCLLCIWMVC